jgi:NADH:ubiquinone oxidoreductase subunit 6 (subunit J)
VGGQEGWLLGRSEDNQQLWWHLWDLGNTGVPGHWLPSSWGLLLGAGGSAALLSFWALLSATRPVEAVFSFLGLLLSLLVPFFALEADYVAVIHLMVYSGAILIFFSFATLTTDQRGHWDQWYGGSVAPRAGLTGQGSSKLGADLLPLLVAGPLLLLWWQQLKHRLHGSVATRSFEYSSDDFLYGALPRELTLSSDLMTLGLEIFQRRLLSLTLLGLLLLLAFLTALELLAPRRQRRRSSSFFPKLGMVGAALVYMANPFEGWDPERLEALESS